MLHTYELESFVLFIQTWVSKFNFWSETLGETQ